MSALLAEVKSGDRKTVEQHHVLGQQAPEVLQLQILVADGGRCRRHAPPAMVFDVLEHIRHYPGWVTTKRDDWCDEHTQSGNVS